MIKALIYNEWRQQRAAILWIFFSQLVLWLGVQLCLGVRTDAMLNLATLLALANGGIPIIYGVVACNIYSLEMKNQTINNLLNLPVSPSCIFWCKFFFCYSVVLLLMATAIISGHCFEPRLFPGVSTGMTSNLMYFCTFTLLLGSAAPYALTFSTGSRYHPLKSVWGLLIGASSVLLWVVAFVIVCSFDFNMVIEAIVLSFLATFVVVGLIMQVASWWLWTRYVTRGLPTDRPMLRQGSILFICAIVLNIGLIIWTHWQWRVVSAEAVRWQISPPKEEASIYNADHLLREFDQRWAKISNLQTPFDYKPDKSEQNKTKEQRWQKFVAQMDSPEMRDAGELLHRVLAVPPSVSKSDDVLLRFRLSGYLYAARCYWYWRGLTLAHEHRDREFAAVVNDLIRLSELYPQITGMERLNGLDCACRLALSGLADSFSDTSVFRTLLKRLENLDCWTDYGDQEDLFLGLGSLFPETFMTPCTLSLQTRQLQRQIERRRLASGHRVYSEIEADAQKLFRRHQPKVSARESNFDDNPIKRYYQNKIMFDLYRMALALRIYNIEHHSFPESLDALVPAYLSAIPFNSYDGTPWVYLRQDRGFTVGCYDKAKSPQKVFKNQVSYQPFHEAIK